MAPTLEERDVKERLAVDLEEIERGEDLLTRELARVRVAMVVYLEVALVFPAVDEDAVDDRGVALRLSHDRVVQLARPSDLPFVTKEVRVGVADANEDSRA